MAKILSMNDLGAQAALVDFSQVHTQ